jgi:tetratricopeptide (TPR) repeat protein
MRLRGAWSAAENEATRAADDLADIRPYQAQAFNELGMIHLNMGDLDGAEGEFRKAHSLGLIPMPGLAMLTLTRGDILGGWAMIESALAGTRDDLARAKLIPPAIEMALAADMVDDAKVLAGELAEIGERYQSELLGVFALQAKGRIAAKEERFSDAMVPLREVVEKLVSWGMPYEAARARCDLGLVLKEMGSDALGSLEITAARTEFERLGASPELERISTIAVLADSQAVNRSLTTMMFTDIVDSTRLIGLIGDEAWADLISWHDRTIRGLLQTHDGSEIDRLGRWYLERLEQERSRLPAAR